MNKTLVALASGAGALTVAQFVRARRRIDFAGRVVLITGGSRGLGLVMAHLFAAEGARLALLARTAEDLEKAKEKLDPFGVDVHLVPCDVRNREEVEAAIAGTVERYGRLDVLINNAGVIQVGPVKHMQQQDFQDALDVHFWAAYYATEAALPHLRAQGDGRIVNIASIAGQVAVPHLAPYVAASSPWSATRT